MQKSALTSSTSRFWGKFSQNMWFAQAIKAKNGFVYKVLLLREMKRKKRLALCNVVTARVPERQLQFFCEDRFGQMHLYFPLSLLCFDGSAFGNGAWSIFQFIGKAQVVNVKTISTWGLLVILTPHNLQQWAVSRLHTHKYNILAGSEITLLKFVNFRETKPHVVQFQLSFLSSFSSSQHF